MAELERPVSSRSHRPSKFTQTISRFKGIIRIPIRKAPTQGASQKSTLREGRQQAANDPYPRTSTTARRESMKPYMSQPMLGLQRSSLDTDPYQHSHHGSDVSSSTSPDPSPSRLNSDFPLPTQSQLRLSRRQSSHSLSSQPIEGLPRVSNDSGMPPTPPPKSARHSVPILRPGTPISPPPPDGNSTSGGSGSKALDDPLSSAPSQIRSRPPRPVRPLPQVPSNPNPSSFLSMATVTENVVVTYGSSPAVPTRNSLLASALNLPSEPPVRALPQPTVESLLRSASEADGQTLQDTISGEATVVQNTPTTPTRPLKLSLPNLSRRISLLQATGGARLSPTIIHRPPPLPILNLPKLPTNLPSNGDDALAGESSLSRRRSARIGLGSMPALPIQGSLRGAGAHEEVDDMEDDDDDEDMDDIDEEVTDDEHSYSHGADDDDASAHLLGTATSDTDSGSGFSDEGLLSRGSYDLARSPPEASTSLARRSGRPELPPLSLASPLDIRFQANSASTPGIVIGAEGTGSPSWDKKGKQVQAIPSSPLSSGYLGSVESESVEPSPYMGAMTSKPSRPSLLVSTPRSSYHSFVSVAESISFSRSEGSDKTPSAQQRPDPFLNARPQSPLATPRAMSPLSPTGDSPALKGNWERNSMFVQRPSFHKRASRSLVDLHSMATKEAIEKMMREEEEKQERVRRHMSLRRSDTDGASGVRMSVNIPKPLVLVEETSPKRAHDADATRITTTELDALDALGGGTGLSNAGETSQLATTGPGGVQAGFNGPGMDDGGFNSSAVDEAKHQNQNRIGMAPAYEVAMGALHSSNPLQAPLRRRRSMPTYNEATSPPPYPSFAPYPFNRHPNLQISPREDEGREELPAYSNPIYLKAIMPRKMEFSEPGMQAKDRKWKRVLCVLEGTMFKVYRCPVGPGGVSAIEQWWERKVGAGDAAAHLTGPSSSAAAPPGPGATRQPANADAGGRSREGEKANQQYLRYPVQDELLVDGGSETPDEDEEQSMSQSQHSNVHSTGQTRRSRLPHPPPAQVAITKSALNLAVHFLKPGSRHGRSNSDAGPPSPSSSKPSTATLPRSSLNLPRSGTATPTSSSFSSTSRSHSPLPSGSSSSLGVPHRSHSPMPSSSRLNVPSSSSSTSSRPTTPSTGGSSGRPAPRLRNHDTPTPPRSARSGSTSGSKHDEVPEPHEHDLIRCYTMQHAESGLGNDYLKRKNVIRVRLEGEQFLLQAKDVPSVVQWIEGLQAATNIALDLDERPMPRGPIFPRRRRRRRPQVPPIVTEGTVPTTIPATVIETYTPTSATAGQPALRRTG